MINHYIVMASAYSIGKRIVLDYHSESELQLEQIKKDIDYINEFCGTDIALSSHLIQTESTSWESVENKDNFFKNTLVIKDKEEFTKILLKDRYLTGMDVAKYILSIVPCTHLKLQKLVYMCYADYLCNEFENLFNDKIYAYRLGPVIESVYEKYKKSGYGKLAVEDDELMYNEESKQMSSQSRIIASKNGLKKLLSIEKTINKYGKYTASELVELTHKKNTPWKKTSSGLISNKLIKDELIKEYHYNETV